MVGVAAASILRNDGARPRGSTHHLTMGHLVGLAMVGLARYTDQLRLLSRMMVHTLEG